MTSAANLWPWIAFHVFLFGALAVDLGFFHKREAEPRFRESLAWVVVWVALALLFNGGIYFWQGRESALEFFAGYLLEWSLSVDNLFVFITIFSAFRVPSRYQHRVLFWGILGALGMRALFIFFGISLLSNFHWLIYVFGGFLIVTGLKMLFQSEENRGDPKDHWLVKALGRWIPMTKEYHGARFFILNHGKWFATPLFLVLIVVEATDLVFAADSIPAILAITQKPFVVYTSNIFAILGLRSIFFVLAGLMSLFRFLKYGLAAVLIFVGIKMSISHWYNISISMSLLVIGFFLGGSVVVSLLMKPTGVASANNNEMGEKQS